MLTFGPVPSRRLGRSLGLNTIPPKTCSYSCLYCQVGRTDTMQCNRQSFFAPDVLFADVVKKVEEVDSRGEKIDYLTIVSDGEPTLDSNLGRTISLLKPLGINIAVISNASLLPQESVRRDLSMADWVSLKIDAARKDTWRKINRPHPDLELAAIMEAMLHFAKTFKGVLATETMLVAGVNDSLDALSDVAEFLGKLNPARAYLSIPTRPPVEDWIHPPSEQSLHAAYQLFAENVENVECLFEYEGSDFFLSDSFENDLLDIVAVHPIAAETIRELLTKAGADWSTIDSLISRGLLFPAEYQGKVYYLRRIRRPSAGTNGGRIMRSPKRR